MKAVVLSLSLFFIPAYAENKCSQQERAAGLASAKTQEKANEGWQALVGVQAATAELQFAQTAINTALAKWKAYIERANIKANPASAQLYQIFTLYQRQKAVNEQERLSQKKKGEIN